jgi:hypothetical protein
MDQKYKDWNYESIVLSGDYDCSILVPSTKIVIYHAPGAPVKPGQLSLTVNGLNDDNKKIVIDALDLPFTLESLMVKSLLLTKNGNDEDMELSVLSFN